MSDLRYKLVFTVPHPALERCKDAIFAAGAGQYPMGKYKRVCFQTSGQTQFFPYGDAVPSIGVVDRLEVVGEVKVETMCVGRDVMLKSVAALKEAHPYEEPAYEVYKIEDV